MTVLRQGKITQKITPFFWFDKEAEEAVDFYTSVFKQSKVNQILRYGKSGPGPEGSVMTASFELEGMGFTALNGGPHYKINQAISFVVNCESQEEVDYYWDRLSDGGEIQQCGWLTDKFGVTWQVVPVVLPEMLSDPDPRKTERVINAMMQMIKLDIATLRRAYEQE